MPPDYPARRRLTLASTAFGCEVYANLFRCGASGASAPLVVFIDDALPAASYIAQRHDIPRDVVAACSEAATTLSPAPAFDLLIFSPPPQKNPSPWGITLEMTHHLLFELLPRTPCPHPPIMALVGHGYGAFLATSLALTIPVVRVLCTLGGDRLLEAARGGGGHEVQAASLHGGADEPAAAATEMFARELERRGIATQQHRHVLTDTGLEGYKSSGALHQAFIAALRPLVQEETRQG